MKLKTAFPCFLLIFVLIFSACEFFNFNFDDEDEDKFVPNAFELEVFRLTNIERAEAGLPILIWHDTLALAARKHSEDLMLNNMTRHTGSDGSTVRQRMERAGLTSLRVTAENCAYGYSTPQAVVTGWMNSPGHKDNILRTTVTHLGVGFVPRPQGYSATYSTYWTQKFCSFW